MKFEDSMKRLTEISALMSGDDLSLEEALKLYAEAAELAESCKEEMQNAQVQLKEIFAAGN